MSAELTFKFLSPFSEKFNFVHGICEGTKLYHNLLFCIQEGKRKLNIFQLLFDFITAGIY